MRTPEVGDSRDECPKINKHKLEVTRGTARDLASAVTDLHHYFTRRDFRFGYPFLGDGKLRYTVNRAHWEMWENRFEYCGGYVQWYL